MAQLARNVIAQDPLSGHLFVFAIRKRNRIKILHWDREWYAIWMKRLESGSFRRPTSGADRVEWIPAELAAMLGGIDLNATRKRPRFTLQAS